MRLPLIMLLVLALNAAVPSAGYTQARNTSKGESMAQKWEYKVISRGRTAEYEGSVRLSIKVSDWTYWDDGKAIGSLDMVAKLRELGEAGWELVSVFPQSTSTGGDFAGFTSEVVWIFKRPK